MTAAVLDPGVAIAEAIRELVDSVRKVVDEDTDDPGLLDELSKLLGRARRRINKARKATEEPKPVESKPTTAPATVDPPRPVVRPVAIPAPPARKTVTLSRNEPGTRSDSQPIRPSPSPQEQPSMSTPQPPDPRHQPHYQPPAPSSYSPSYHPASQAPMRPRRRRIWPWVLIGVVVLFFGGCLAVLANVGKEVKEQSRPVMVTYEITGQGTANTITYVKDVNLGQEQLTGGTKLPWRHDVQFGEGFFKPISIVAQAGDGTGAISCRILVDGTEVAKSTSQGQFAVVTCSGDVPKR